MMYPSQLLPTSVPPTWEPLQKTRRSTGDVLERQSWISRRNGVLEVRQGPGSDELLVVSTR